MKRIILHIDRLVLKGFRHEDRHGIAEGLQHELTRLLANTQAVHQLTANGDISRLRVSRVPIGQGANPQRIGLQVAQGIGKGLKT